MPARSAGRTGRGRRAGDPRVEGPEQAAPPGPQVGDRVEPGADLAPAAVDFPDDESMRISPRGDLPGALSSRAAAR